MAEPQWEWERFGAELATTPHRPKPLRDRLQQPATMGLTSESRARLRHPLSLCGPPARTRPSALRSPADRLSPRRGSTRSGAPGAGWLPFARSGLAWDHSPDGAGKPRWPATIP